MINSATKLIAGTKFEASQLINSGVKEEKIAIIPNAIDPNQLKDVSESGLFKNYLNLNNERIILYIGRLHRNKGIDVLLKAFHKVSRELEDVRLVIAGPDDNYLNVLVKIRDQLNLKDKVYFTDLLDRRQVQAAYTDASAVVYVSLQEGFPTVLLEAGFFSKPVIVSDHPSMNFIENGKSGMVVQYGNERQLEQSLVKILDNGDFAEKLGRNLNGYVTKKLTWSSISKEIESLYSNLVNN
jgi:glycosyltransferase involved in cell wall biosynthesis